MGGSLDQVYRQIGDRHEQIQAGLCLPLLDPSGELNPDTLFRLAMVTAFQIAETMPDIEAVEAAMTRGDWEYTLRLPAIHNGITVYSLCKFRETFYSSTTAIHEYKKLLDCLADMKLFSGLMDGSPEAMEVITTVCKISRLSSLRLAMKSSLSCLVACCPDLLRANALPHWYERYKTGKMKQSGAGALADLNDEAIRLGKDIQYLLEAIGSSDCARRKDQVEIHELRRLFQGEFSVSDRKISWRNPTCITCTNILMRHARSNVSSP